MKKGNDLREKKFQSVCKDFRDDFVDDVTKANRPKLVSRMRATELGNQSYKGVVLISLKEIIAEKILDAL